MSPLYVHIALSHGPGRRLGPGAYLLLRLRRGVAGRLPAGAVPGQRRRPRGRLSSRAARPGSGPRAIRLGHGCWPSLSPLTSAVYIHLVLVLHAARAPNAARCWRLLYSAGWRRPACWRRGCRPTASSYQPLGRLRVFLPAAGNRDGLGRPAGARAAAGDRPGTRCCCGTGCCGAGRRADGSWWRCAWPAAGACCA